MTIKEMQQECWQTADDHGWHDQPRTVGDELALIHSEVSEALEAFREHGLLGFNQVFIDDRPPKPEGVGSELADVLIRIGDFCGEHEINLELELEKKMRYNKTRPYRHGGKRL